MKAVVLGAGMMGSVIALDLVKSEEVSSVLVCDIDEIQLQKCAAADTTGKMEILTLDVSDEDALVEVLDDAFVAVSALAHTFSPGVLRASIKARTHAVDLVGSLPKEKLALDDEATRRGVSIIPGFGLAPGLTNVLVGLGFAALDSVHTAVAAVGGLPLQPSGPLNYHVLYSMESTFNQFVRDALIVRDGEIVRVRALSDLEVEEYPEPVGRAESFVTDGLSTLPFTLTDPHLDYMAEKTIRYPGHADKIQTLIDCGLFDEEPIDVGGTEVVPRKVLDALLRPRLHTDDPRDVSVLRTRVSGMKDDQNTTCTYEMVDLYDEEQDMTSMARTTGFPVAAAVRMLIRGDITERGVLPPETTFIGKQYDVLTGELARYGITITESISRD